MSEFSQDNLNQFFRRKLGEDANEEGMWNVPPDFVFDNAMQKVSLPNKKQKRSKKWLLLLLIPFGFMSALFYNYQNNLHSLENELLGMSQLVKIQNEQIAKLEATVQNKVNIEESEVTGATVKIIDDIEEKVVQLQPKESYFTSTNQVIQVNQVKPNTEANEHLQSNSEKVSEPGSISDSNATLLHHNSVSDLKDISVSKLNKYASKERLESIGKVNSLIIGFDRSIPLYLAGIDNLGTDKLIDFDESIIYGFYINQNHASLTMQNAVETCELDYYDSHYSGMGFQFITEKPISKKVSMQFGLGYQSINSRSEMNQVNYFDYDNAVEMPSGDMNYYMDLTVETPFGEVSSPTNFMVDGSTLDNDVINQKTEIQQQLNVLSLNVGPKFNILKSKNLTFFANTSLGYNRVVHYKNDMTTALEMDAKEMTKFDSSPLKIKDINRNFMSIQGGLGMSLNLSDKTQFVVSANYSNSINSLRIASAKSDPTVYLKQWNTLMGLSVKF